jgi:hypothetical protein
VTLKNKTLNIHCMALLATLLKILILVVFQIFFCSMQKTIIYHTISTCHGCHCRLLFGLQSRLRQIDLGNELHLRPTSQEFIKRVANSTHGMGLFWLSLFLSQGNKSSACCFFCSSLFHILALHYFSQE